MTETTSPVLSPATVKIGDGVTEGVGSDRYAGTITSVSKSGKTIKFTHDEARRTDSNGFSEIQTWEYESTPVQAWEDPIFGAKTNEGTARWSEKRQRFVVSGSKRALGSGRHQYWDPHF